MSTLVQEQSNKPASDSRGAIIAAVLERQRRVGVLWSIVTADDRALEGAVVRARMGLSIVGVKI